ncbi:MULTISPECIES: PH domain-containing protein [unclassified Pseudactinotalea]|uniref:PH domain-containing protein n=1 Tax=Micrococcales TaxID=85006 RepID=UPI003C7BAACC
MNAWKVGVVIFAIAVYNSQEFMSDLRERFAAAAILGALVALLVVGFVLGLGLGYLAWRRTQYGVSRESLFLHKGVLFRQQRHVRLDRVQAVEVTQPLLARLFGFASVKVESAGGAGSNLMIAFLSEPDAQNLRNELLARSAGVKLGSSGSADATGSAGAHGSPVAPAAPEREIAEITPGRLIGSLALSFSIALIVLAILGLVAASIAVGNASIVLGALAPMLGAATYFWGRFAGEFNFRAAVSPDGIRLRHGLLETKSRTVPPGRVQAVRISQPPLWRIKDWWRMQVNIAGYGAEEVTGTVLYPAATRAEVAYMLSLVLPDLGDERPLPVLHAGMDGIGDVEGFTTSPRRARWVDPLTWRRTGFRVTGTAILMRTGRWWRYLSVVPHERTQSIGLTQGPIERKMGLATFVVHSTPGPVTPQVHHLDLQVARELLVNQAERSRRARREAGPERWMSTPGTAAAQAPAPAPAEVNRGAYAGVLPSRPRPPSVPHDEPAGAQPPPPAPAQPWTAAQPRAAAPPPSAPPGPPGPIPPAMGQPPSQQTPPGLAPTRPDARGDHPA